jgi:hypothetical protein
MKPIYALALLFGASLAVTSSARAQTPAVEAHIPFDFTVANTWMPAGDYVISSPLMHVVQVRKSDGSAFASVIAMHSNHESRSGSKLEFTKYGDRYFLHRVLCPTNTAMNDDLARSKSEKKARTLEASIHDGEEILLAAN